MGRGSKIFWVIISILFAFGAIGMGSLYQAKKTKELNTTISKTTETTETTEAPSSDSSTETKAEEQEKDESADEKNNSTKKTTDESDDKVVEITSTDGQNAQQLIDVIIVNGQVQGDFTLDEYYIAKNAVDALPSGAEKNTLNKEIKQIETAMTNMGISY